ncbi:GNAT family N-acetyltransferase [Martelella endophytica]|uniref:GCN5 family acetyltransferase n=1 Tax=Martelella endophytica TaxID=1486262 RepID=A0A0D5LU69_MAREN|nr:N-acetyltransferase [Martelella endophytica]AJY46888.1 GCN5 family acetyltransferase [Martelella endophytica]
MIIRRERFEDVKAVDALVRKAFQGMPYSDGSEPAIIRRLRKAGALSLALVAEEDGKPVGHIAFSPVGISDGASDWFGLGPLAVRPDFQRREIGTALVLGGLELLRDDRAGGVVVLGSPQFYQRFGFRCEPSLTLEGAPPDHFMALPFEGDVPAGKVAFHRAFYGEG